MHSVFLYGQSADVRRSYDGLYALARQGFEVDPLGGRVPPLGWAVK